MIKYIGSKRVLIPSILAVIEALPYVRSVLDVFSGTARVGHALKERGYQVLANDHNAYAATLARCYVEADRDDVLHDAEKLIKEFNSLRGRPGYFTQTFCVESQFFQPKNGERVDAIREEIEKKSLPPQLKAVVLVSLMEAADRVDSTTGLQMAYLKRWAPRAYNDIELRLPNVLPRAQHGKGLATQQEAFEFVDSHQADLAYLDPPYNQHKYLGNYHIWETLVLWDKPSAYGTARKRSDCRERSSVFNSKPRFEDAFDRLVKSVRAKWLLVSFNNEGYLNRATAEKLLGQRGEVRTLELDHKRYVGAQIGIHNPTGRRVGKVGHLRNKELLYLAGPRLSKSTELQKSAQLRLFV